jgi:CheY-like chemotaxis protein
MTKSLPPKNFILYADDDPDDRSLMEELFEEHAEIIELLTFPDGAELLQYLQHSDDRGPKPCLIILDINMPGLNGKRVLKDIREMQGYEEVPVVFFTTSTLPSEAAFARSFNAGFITKPLSKKQLHHIFDHLLDHCTEEVKRRINKK